MIKYLEQRYHITDENYADLIIGYIGNDEEIVKRFGDVNYQLIDQRTIIVYLPLSRLNRNSIHRHRYSAFPKLYGLLNQEALEASGITRIQNNFNFGLRGQGVLVGFIDTGIDFTNELFRNADGTTRIVSIWDQSIESENYPDDIYYGTEYNMESINEALQSEDPLSVIPCTDEIGHGTFIAGITAGNEVRSTGFTGVVPAAGIISVKLKDPKTYIKDFFHIPASAVCYEETDIMQGVKYLLQTARKLRRPLVICIPLGTSQGAHSGSGAIDSYLSIVGDESGVAIVTPAGNEGNAKLHYYGEIDRNTGYQQVELKCGEGESGFSMEIWGNSPGTYSIDLLSPMGEYISRIPARLNERRDIRFIFESTLVQVDYQLIESRTGNELILLRFENPTPGIWRINVYGEGDLPLIFHCWLPLHDFITEETFFLTSNPYNTVTSPGNATTPITATAYDPSTEGLYQNAGRGYTYFNGIKPDIAAPGININGPLPNGRFVRMSGSSTAAAFTAGTAAMMLEWGIINGNYRHMNTIEIKKIMIRGARRKENMIYPNREWGYGILDIYNAYESLRGEFIR